MLYLAYFTFTGDLFECFEDLENPELWQNNSENSESQQQSRISVLRVADVIVPGHGKLFEVPKAYKHQMRVVMYYEEFSETIDGHTTGSMEYHVWEDGDNSADNKEQGKQLTD